MMTGLRFQRGGDLAIDLILLLLGRQAVAVDEQIFRAEQSDAFGAMRQMTASMSFWSSMFAER